MKAEYTQPVRLNIHYDMHMPESDGPNPDGACAFDGPLGAAVGYEARGGQRTGESAIVRNDNLLFAQRPVSVDFHAAFAHL